MLEYEKSVDCLIENIVRFFVRLSGIGLAKDIMRRMHNTKLRKERVMLGRGIH